MTAPKPQRRSQAERSSETQERIILAAIDVLRTRGFAGLRVADVTEVAGVSRGAQSHHFHSKAELVLAVFARVFEDATEQSRTRIAAVRPDDDIVAALVADASAFFLGENFSIGLDLLGAADRDPELRDGVQAIARSNRLLVETMWMAELARRGLSPAAAEDILWLVFSVIRGLSVRQLWQNDEARFDRVKRLAYDAGLALYQRHLGAPVRRRPAAVARK